MSYSATLFRYAPDANIFKEDFGSINDDCYYVCYDFNKEYSHMLEKMSLREDNLLVKSVDYYTSDFLNYALPSEDGSSWADTPIFEFDNVDLSFVENQFEFKSRVKRNHRLIALEEMFDISPASCFNFNDHKDSKYGDFSCSFLANKIKDHTTDNASKNIMTFANDIDILQKSNEDQIFIVMVT